ncbi:hypothetical protein NMG60_11012152 [Bertholletia excelsa]
MEKQLVVCGLFILALALTCSATMYTVGDMSGWDISTDADTWVQDKHFVVGDVLLFQYSSYHSVSEVTKENYEGCKTTDVLQTSSNGNTTFPLNKPGDRYFVCGNRLHCLGGMKLHVKVDGQSAAAQSPAVAPQADSGNSLPTNPSSKSNNPSSVVPNLAQLVQGGMATSFALVFVGFVSALFWMV